MGQAVKILLFANSDWYLYNFRLALAQAARAQGHEVVLLSPPGAYVPRLEQAGFRWVEARLSRRSLNPLGELAAIWRLVRLYRQEKPDLVHHFTVKCVLYGSVAARLAGVAAVVNAVTGLGHVFSASGPAMRLLRPWVTLFYRLALRGTQVVFQNPDDRAAFLAPGLTTSAASHLIRGSGVDVQHFCPQPHAGKNKAVLLASRLLWAKGVGEYVAAARRVRSQLPEVKFLIAGVPDPDNPGSIPPEVIARWKKQGDVILLGQREDMAELMGQVDVLVLPSYYGEGVPRCLIEGAASGLALVASDMPGCREVVKDGVNGLLVPPRDGERLAEAVLALLRDDKLRAAMGEKSREIACAGFSAQQVIDETLQVYRIARQC